MEGSAISWTDHTFNCWIGCEHAPASDDPADARTSPGCDNCYAEAMDARFSSRLVGGHWGAGSPRRFLSDAYWRKPLAWNARAEKRGVRERVFWSSLADWAEIRDGEVGAAMDRERTRMWNLIEQTPWLDHLLLSKRPQNWARLLPWVRTPEAPWPNVWLGVTGENTEQLLRRVAILRRTPAVKRFISAEPLLEHISAAHWDQALAGGRSCVRCGGGVAEVSRGVCAGCFGPTHEGRAIDWLIVGDESGPHRRPAQLDWVRTAREAALRHGVAFHLKQLHQAGKKVHLPLIDGRQHPAIPR